MSNGIDPIQILLDQVRDLGGEVRAVRQMLGGFGEALRQGHTVHQEIKAHIIQQNGTNLNLHGRVKVLEAAKKTEAKETKSWLAEWTEFLNAFWPYLAILMVVVAKLVLGSAGPATQLIEHLGGKG